MIIDFHTHIFPPFAVYLELSNINACPLQSLVKTSCFSKLLFVYSPTTFSQKWIEGFFGFLDSDQLDIQEIAPPFALVVLTVAVQPYLVVALSENV